MFASIIGDIVSGIFRKAVRAMFAITIVGVVLLGAGFATGNLHTDDLRPESIHKVLVFCQDRVSMIKEFAGDLSGVDYTGVVRGLREREQALEELGETASPYEDVPLTRLQELTEGAESDLRPSDDDGQSGSDAEGEVVRASIF